MSQPDPDLSNVTQRLDRYAARLNPGLCAVALVLSVLVLAEITARLPALYEQDVATANVPLGSDPTSLVPIDILPSQ